MRKKAEQSQEEGKAEHTGVGGAGMKAKQIEMAVQKRTSHGSSNVKSSGIYRNDSHHW